jgi:hypothetical protein
MICLSTGWFVAAIVGDAWIAAAIGFTAAALFQMGGRR